MDYFLISRPQEIDMQISVLSDIYFLHSNSASPVKFVVRGVFPFHCACNNAHPVPSYVFCRSHYREIKFREASVWQLGAAVNRGYLGQVLANYAPTTISRNATRIEYADVDTPRSGQKK